jgi:hypothetical protein
MRTLITLVSMGMLLLSSPSYGQNPNDAAAVKAVALEYIEGYYASDVQRVEKVLHPDLVKRTVMADPQTGKSYLVTQGFKDFLNLTEHHKNAPGAKLQKDVIVLDVFKDAAMVKVTATEWVDYMQMHKWNGKWVIVNLLWERRQPGGNTLWDYIGSLSE